MDTNSTFAPTIAPTPNVTVHLHSEQEANSRLFLFAFLLCIAAGVVIFGGCVYCAYRYRKPTRSMHETDMGPISLDTRQFVRVQKGTIAQVTSASDEVIL